MNGFSDRLAYAPRLDSQPQVLPPAADVRGRRGRARRIVLMTNCVGTGGAEQQLVQLAIRLRRCGDEVSVISLVPFFRWERELQEAGVGRVALVAAAAEDDPVPLFAGVRAVRPGLRALRALRPDALICFVHEASLFGRVIGRLAGVPVIIGSERLEWTEGLLDTAATRLTDRLLSVTTTNSQVVARDLVARRVVPPHRIQVIPNGIDVEAFADDPVVRARVRAELGVADDQFCWVAVGRLRAQKDYPTLLHAFARVARDHPRAQLRIVGSGELGDELRALTARLQITHRVAFLGLRTDVPAVLAAADALVMSSAHEGLPNAVMEALAAGLPVVATRVGGVVELINDGVNGLLVTPGEAGALGAAMAAVGRMTPAQRHELGEAGRAQVRAYCDWGEVVRRWSELIEHHLRPGVG